MPNLDLLKLMSSKDTTLHWKVPMQQNLPFLAVSTGVHLHPYPSHNLSVPLGIMEAAVPVENSQCTRAVHISMGSGHWHCLHLKMLQVGETPRGICRSQQQWEYLLVLTSWWLLRAATCGWILGLWQSMRQTGADRGDESKHESLCFWQNTDF